MRWWRSGRPTRRAATTIPPTTGIICPSTTISRASDVRVLMRMADSPSRRSSQDPFPVQMDSFRPPRHGLRLRPRSLEAPGEPHLLPGRGRGERRRSCPLVHRGPGASEDPHRPRRRRRPALRHPLAGRRADRVLRVLEVVGELFGPIFVPEEFGEAVSGRTWLRAMVDAEGALALALARAGLIPMQTAETIVSCCDADRFDPEEIGRRGRAQGNPVPPLVRALTEAVSEVAEDAASYVHKGAPSQDIMDTAAMLVSRHALGLILTEVEGVAAACARLADTHRDTMMPGRTLLQQALPTTFGSKAAGWLVSVLEARNKLLTVREAGLAVQLGGAAGTLASLGPAGTRVLGEFARELDLVEPVVPWHADRVRIAELGGALSLVASVLGKISQDIILMAQTEVGEVTEPAGEGRGGSSTLPHKRNPILSVIAVANARRVFDLSHTLQVAVVGEHERAAGAWHSEWEALSDALALTGGAAAAVREVTEGLEVFPEKMLENLNATGGLLLAENVTTVAAEHLGRLEAHDLVEGASYRALKGGKTLREELLSEPRLGEVLSGEEIDAALDPAGYLGSTGEFVNRALKLYREGGIL